MLTRFHKFLIGLLVVQALLGVLVLMRSDSNAVLKETLLLPGFDAAKVTRLQVFAPPDADATPATPAKSVDLVKRDKSWVVASGFDYPVDGSKVPDALAPLAKIAAAEPLAKQATRHKQLKVADDDYNAKLTLTMDGKDTTLFIGNTLGSRRTAVRIGGSENVYAVAGLTSSAFEPTARAWVAPRYFEVAHDSVEKLTIAHADGTTVELFKTGTAPDPGAGWGNGSAGSGSAAKKPGAGSGSGSDAAPAKREWTATINGAPIPLAVGEVLDIAAIDRAVSAATTIDLDAPADPKRDAGKPTATFTIEKAAVNTAGASPVPAIVDVIADGDTYWVHDRSSPRAITLAKARLDDVVKLDKDHLVKKAPPPGQKPATPPPPPPGDMDGAGGMQLPPGFQMPGGEGEQ